MKLKNNSYVVIEPFMVEKLNLKGNEIIVFAIIHGYTAQKGKYSGTLSYLVKWTNLSKQGILNVLKKLVNKKLITKRTSLDDPRRVEYKSNYIVQENVLKEPKNLASNSHFFLPNQTKKLTQNDKEISPPRSILFDSNGEETLHNNIYNNIRDNIVVSKGETTTTSSLSLGEEEYLKKLKELKSIISNSTGKNPHIIGSVFRPTNYNPNMIDNLLQKIKSSQFLMGEKNRKPDLDIFIIPYKINCILAGMYDDKEVKYNDNLDNNKEVLYGNAKDYDIKPANELVEKLLGIKNLE